MSETIKNLAAAFVGESQARNRYTIYSKIAKKEGFVQISAIFLETATQEAQHAKWLFNMINDLKDAGEAVEEISLEAGVPTLKSTTMENLEAAIGGEHYEHETMYPDFAAKADEEGYPEIAKRLRAIGDAEKHHEERYLKLLAAVKEGKVFKKDDSVKWVCRECGYVHEGTDAPDVCPSCSHPQGYFQVECEKY